MKPFRLLLPAAVGLAAIGLLSGCTLSHRKTVVLWTNRPEMAAYVEHFNARQDLYRLELVYRNDPARSWEAGGRPPDLLLDGWLNTPGRIGRMASLEDLFRRKRLDRDAFYGELLGRGTLEGKQVLLPVAFHLPALVFQPRNLGGEVPGLTLPLDFVRDRAGAFNRLKGNRFDRLGFSPRWDPELLYQIAVLHGVSFQQTGPGEIRWNETALQEALQYVRQWVREVNRDPALDRQFEERYLYNPKDKLLEEDRILFYLSDSERLAASLQSGRDGVDYRWIGRGGRVAVGEEVLWAGIPRGARGGRGARFFLEWLLQPQTQALLLKINQTKRLKVFGICNGFSPLHEVTEGVFPQSYPWLIGHIPAGDMLLFPAAPADRWEEVKSQAVLPWLIESLTVDQPAVDLGSRIRRVYTRESGGEETN
jgi:hypothetical protein